MQARARCCTHSVILAVATHTAGDTDGQLRLVSVADVVTPSGSSSGRVEVCYKGQWGTVCGDSKWSYEDARVACRCVPVV